MPIMPITYNVPGTFYTLTLLQHITQEYLADTYNLHLRSHTKMHPGYHHSRCLVILRCASLSGLKTDRATWPKQRSFRPRVSLL